ncbi:hypothetical protein Pcinc_023933 [Petrolisthes cinctipes]|uniref:Uncharacterized protein n=1 Tax=Petrolisthes cinctipes TaxID=88211 RepID=A0AAE1KEE0_PETCI|nr:hypothetical protein Pcinc_023933 [Petrolisthes cinctipes]
MLSNGFYSLSRGENQNKTLVNQKNRKDQHHRPLSLAENFTRIWSSPTKFACKPRQFHPFCQLKMTRKGVTCSRNDNYCAPSKDHLMVQKRLLTTMHPFMDDNISGI